MAFMADFHVHSRYSIATSPEMAPEGLWKWAQIKGIRVIGTGDFTHPEYFRELSEKLEPSSEGLYALKKDFRSSDVPPSCGAEVSFILSAEVSCIYKKAGRVRKVHAIILAPDLDMAGRINSRLSKIGNIASDGRPILGLDAKKLLEITLDVSPRAIFIPAHAWTPHFSVFGAVSGFDSLEECFDDLTPHIRAIETGLSSDPPMNRRLSALDDITLLSNSDAHSPEKLGREANVFDTGVSYDEIRSAIGTGRNFGGTIEFFPEEGKYHLDGHRNCGVSIGPDETRKRNFICPVCGKKLTVGVLHRVDDLADRKQEVPRAPFKYIIPLKEIIAEALGVKPGSKKVGEAYLNLIGSLGNEFGILLDKPEADIASASSAKVAEAVRLVREGKVRISPGFDGQYGVVSIFGESSKPARFPASKNKVRRGQGGLF